LINLGTNDYSTEPHPTDEAFSTGLSTFVGVIQSDYPSAKIGLLCPFSLTDQQCDNIQSVALAMRVEYFRLNPELVQSYGCVMHPDYTAQQSLATAIEPLIVKLFSES